MKKLFLLLALLIAVKSFAQDFNIQFRSNVKYPGYDCSSLWAYVTPDGTEYALVGTEFGVSIVDISDPDNPVVKFNVQHTPSIWREIKTYGHYAYATNEDGGGLLIIDLSQLPDTFYQYSFIYTDGGGNQQNDGHELWIDEKGRLFILGGAYSGEGATIFDLTVDPLNPPFLGSYEAHYIHSAFVRGDTMWASEIWDGQVEVVNVANPAAPVPMASFHTPNNFTHNAWPTHDDHYIFTTDEQSGAYVTSYDVSDLSNITELDRIQSFPGTSVIPHNVHLLNDTFAVTAYYCDGVIIFDVLHPDNMVKVGSYDSYLGTCNGYNGTWGAYPYLPSGNLILSNIEDGLFVLTPTYVQACRIEGTVTDSISGALLNGVTAEILTSGVSTTTDLSGNYKTGIAGAGNYFVRFTKTGYATRIFNLDFVNGQTIQLNVKLSAAQTIPFSGQVVDSASGLPVANADVNFFDGGIQNYISTTDAGGVFSFLSIKTGDYIATTGEWGYETREFVVSVNSSSAISLKIPQGYYDEFYFDEGWTVAGTATAGIWERGEPIGTSSGLTYYNPDLDNQSDIGDKCFVTGNGGGNINYDDVDGGYTSLTSPVFDATDLLNAKVSYDYWFANGGITPTDTMLVEISNGTQTATVRVYTVTSSPASQWVNDEFLISDYITPSATMQVTFTTSESAPENWLESAIDIFRVKGDVATSSQGISEMNFSAFIYPNPFTSESMLRYDFSGMQVREITVDVFDVLGRKAQEFQSDKLNGTISLGASLNDGIYFVEILADGKTQKVLKVVKDSNH